MSSIPAPAAESAAPRIDYALLALPVPPRRPLRCLGPDATPDELIRAAAANHIAWFTANALASGGETRREAGVTWTLTPGSDGEAVIAFPSLTRDNAGPTLDAILEECRRSQAAKVSCWTALPSTRPSDLGARLAARGFEWGWKPHWMALDLARLRAADFPLLEGLHIVLAPDWPDWDVDDLPYYTRRPTVPVTETRRAPRRMWRFGAWLDGRIVGQSLLVLTTGRFGVAGIYNVGVVPDARCRGVGRAITLAACQWARALGCRWATLNAATNIYARLGFVSLGEGQTWWMHGPTLAAPLPTPAQVAFAEAIGRGDTRALNALRLSGDRPADLDAPLPNGMTPMALAVAARQPAAAEWLAGSGATLGLVEAWDLGWKYKIPGLLAHDLTLIDRRSGPLGLTPLHEAAQRGDTDLARTLLAHGRPDLSLRDTQFNGTPLDWARHFGRTEITALLEAAQAPAGPA
jgi:GNAT superfamily N-acetyltransferase